MHIDTFFVKHDLCHYAVEKTLKLKNAFYGMLAAGTNIRDFELPKEQRSFQLSEEAIRTEQIVNLLTIEYNQGEIDNLYETLRKIFEQEGSLNLAVAINAERIEEIRKLFNQLMDQWNFLPDGESMIFFFEN